MGAFGDWKKIAFAAAAAVWLAAALTAVEPGFAQTQATKHAPPRVVHGRLRLTEFYETPVPLPAGKPGELIRSQPFDEYDVPLNVSAVRILYHSISPGGEDVAASGVVLIPDSLAPAGGWPVIAWAHGFMGNARLCAPSLMRNLRSGAFLSMYVNLGYAVVAADYAGLGTSFRNAFGDLRSNASDVIYSVQAARAALPQLGPRWVALGDVEGGATALALAELETARRDPGYLGSAAISGALDFRTVVERLAQGTWQDTLASLAYGIKTAYPQFQVEEMLAQPGLERYREAEQDCVPQKESPAVPASEMLKPGWEKNPLVQSFLENNELGGKPAGAPLLVISDEDPKAPDSMAAQVVARMCRERDRIDFEAYPGEDPGRILGGSVAAQIAWIEARFARRAAKSNCG